MEAWTHNGSRAYGNTTTISCDPAADTVILVRQVLEPGFT